MTDHNFKLSRNVNGWNLEMDHFGTPEDMASFISSLDGIFGPATAAPAAVAAAPAAASGGPVPACPVHNDDMRVSKYGGFYCTKQDAEGNYCDQKVR